MLSLTIMEGLLDLPMQKCVVDILLSLDHIFLFSLKALSSYLHGPR